MGSLQVTDTDRHPDQRPVRHGLDAADHRRRRAAAVPLALGPAGARHRRKSRDGRRGRHQHAARRPVHLRARLRHRRHRRRRLHHDRLDRADRGPLYIVDTFLVVVFGGAQSLLGTIASAFTIAQAQSTLEFFLTGSMAQGAHPAGRDHHPDAAPAGPVRPQGAEGNAPMSDSSAQQRSNRSRLELIGIRAGCGCSSWSFCRCARHLPPQSGRQVSDLRLRRARAGAVLGQRRHSEPGPGRVLRARRLLHGDVPQARGVERRQAPRSSRRRASRTSWTGTS